MSCARTGDAGNADVRCHVAVTVEVVDTWHTDAGATDTRLTLHRQVWGGQARQTL